MEGIKLILAAGNNGVEGALKEFSIGTVNIINIVFGALSGLAAILVLAYIVFLVVRKNNTDPSISEQAEKALKVAVKSAVLVIVIVSVGFTLINTVLKNLVEGLQEKSVEMSMPFYDIECCIPSFESVTNAALQSLK